MYNIVLCTVHCTILFCILYTILFVYLHCTILFSVLYILQYCLVYLHCTVSWCSLYFLAFAWNECKLFVGQPPRAVNLVAVAEAARGAQIQEDVRQHFIFVSCPSHTFCMFASSCCTYCTAVKLYTLAY